MCIAPINKFVLLLLTHSFFQFLSTTNFIKYLASMYNFYENQPPYKSRSTHYSKKLNLYTYQPNLLFLKGNTKGADKLKIFICFKILHVVKKFISKSHQLSLNRILLQLENIFLNLQHFRVDIANQNLVYSKTSTLGIELC